jgi:hypothetical protein
MAFNFKLIRITYNCISNWVISKVDNPGYDFLEILYLMLKSRVDKESYEEHLEDSSDCEAVTPIT